MNIIKTLYRSCSRVSDMIDKVLKVILVLLVLGSALDLFGGTIPFETLKAL